MKIPETNTEKTEEVIYPFQHNTIRQHLQFRSFKKNGNFFDNKKLFFFKFLKKKENITERFL